MIDILKTRLIHIKKQWLSLLFCLLLPIVATVMIIHVTNAIQSDTKVPIGIVLEEETDLAEELFHSVKQSPLIRVYETTEKDALHRLKQHELDSVFIIHNGYKKQIRKGKRDQIITSYLYDLTYVLSMDITFNISYI